MSRSIKLRATSSFFFILLISLLVPACKHSSSASSYQGPPENSGGGDISPPVTTSSHRNLPYGFTSIPAASGQGEVLYGGMTGTSASGALWGALTALAPYFDQKPNVLGAMVSANDDEVQALLDGTRDGQAVRGMGYARTTGSQCVVAVLFDRADQFSQTSAELTRLAEQQMPASSASTPVPLQRTTLSDGTILDLPGGWTVKPNNGPVSGTGPEGSFDFGLATEVYTPEVAAQLAAPYGARAPLVSAYGDPAREIQELSAQMQIVGSPDDIQIVEQTPLPWWTSGPGAMLHIRGTIQGIQSEGVAQVLTSPSGYGKWMYYYSGVSCQQSAFTQNLPVLLRIWQSWKTDDHVFQERLQRAAEAMQATAQIIRGANAFRQDAIERSSMAWDHIVRGTWPIEDQQTHTRYVPQQDVSILVRQLNESEGYDRWRVVPYEQLNR